MNTPTPSHFTNQDRRMIEDMVTNMNLHIEADKKWKTDAEPFIQALKDAALVRGYILTFLKTLVLIGSVVGACTGMWVAFKYFITTLMVPK